jgi:4-deoxy-L-threo-5-hexosulose-uronate ketol-isomerase
MEVRYAPNDEAYQRMTTAELRRSFVIDNLFAPNSVTMIYSDVDRVIVGSAVPLGTPLKLESSKKEMAAKFFAERRELGIINIGGEGNVRVDGKGYAMMFRDLLYVGRGVREIQCSSADPMKPALFYFISYPAHASYPVAHARFNDSLKSPLGSAHNANARTITKYVHTEGIKSSQLVMGLTELNDGSVWNTMPSHTHQRRTEVYLYFGLDEESFVVHLMGKPSETRDLIIRNQQVVISPPWSIHSAAGTRNYSFIWAMGGENQNFSDMDAVPMKELL